MICRQCRNDPVDRSGAVCSRHKLCSTRYSILNEGLVMSQHLCARATLLSMSTFAVQFKNTIAPCAWRIRFPNSCKKTTMREAAMVMPAWIPKTVLAPACSTHCEDVSISLDLQKSVDTRTGMLMKVACYESAKP